MNRINIGGALGLALLLFVGSAATADAATLYTPPIEKDGWGTYSTANCSIVNVGKKEQQVTIEVWLAGAQPPEASPEVTLYPGSAYHWSATGCTDGCVYYCKFIVSGGKRNFRAVGCVKPEGGGCSYVVPAN